MIAEEIAANIEARITLSALIGFSGVAASVLLALPTLMILSDGFLMRFRELAIRVSMLLYSAAAFYLGSICLILLYGGILYQVKAFLLVSYYLIIIATLFLIMSASLFGLCIVREVRRFP